MEEHLLSTISDLLGLPILECQTLSGGDISSAYRIRTRGLNLFAKINHRPDAELLFQAEVSGLTALQKAGIFRIPEVKLCTQVNGVSVLVLEYIDSIQPSSGDFELFGRSLALQHGQTSAFFGFGEPNFIGSLRQVNGWYRNWREFYVSCRLVPQFSLAGRNRLLSVNAVPDEDILDTVLANMFPETEPALIHGDLWSGNYLISKTHQPCLIDPAVCYGHSEMDLAMSRLFGGFGRSFYDAYDEMRPPVRGHEERCDVYQLYYLLVHLNIFGISYQQPVLRIIKKYFG